MSTTETGPQTAPEADSDASPIFVKVVAVYGDHAAHERVERVHDCLREELDVEVHCSVSWWKLDFLRHPEMFLRAVEDALQADVLVFSFRRQEDLPPKGKEWLEAWETRRKARLADWAEAAEQEEPSVVAEGPASGFLLALARRAGLAFFPHILPGAWEITCCLVDKSSEAGRRLIPWLKELTQRKAATRNWGIND
jgi:hypothetical protein